MMSASGLVMPARKRGFWLRMAARSVLPERGSPETKWNFRADFATWGVAGMCPILSMFHFLRSGRPALGGDLNASGRHVPSAHLDDQAASEGIPSGDNWRP